MSEVQITLLSLGLFIILIMLIHNWIQLSKHNKNKLSKASKKTEITDDNDPLFNPANPIFERESSFNPDLEGNASEHLIRENLPNGIFREIETVASITTKEIQNGIKHKI